MRKAKCLLTLEQSEVDPDNHYKPGDYFIGGVFSAMKARFQSLHFARSPSTKFSKSLVFTTEEQKRKLHPFLQSPQFHNNSMDGVYLDEKGDLTADLDIVNWVIFPNRSIKRVKSGSLEKQASQDLKIFIDQKSLTLVEKLNKIWKPCLAPELGKPVKLEFWKAAFISSTRSSHSLRRRLQCITFHAFLQTPQFYNHSIDGVYFDENGEPAVDLDIVNWMVYSNKSVTRTKSGHLERQGVQDSKLVIDQNNIAQMEKMNKLHPFLKNHKIYNNTLDGMYVDGNGNLMADFDILSWNSNDKVVPEFALAIFQKSVFQMGSN
ncbi:hypothetical protein E2320_014266 [Naja naja]|nr:hypothetical protein E2320_014266 [Naja naja]